MAAVRRTHDDVRSDDLLRPKDRSGPSSSTWIPLKPLPTMLLTADRSHPTHQRRGGECQSISTTTHLAGVFPINFGSSFIVVVVPFRSGGQQHRSSQQSKLSLAAMQARMARIDEEQGISFDRQPSSTCTHSDPDQQCLHLADSTFRTTPSSPISMTDPMTGNSITSELIAGNPKYPNQQPLRRLPFFGQIQRPHRL
ncbi:hypothetical protein ACLOJK_019512 [Asimina triloba]